LIAATKWAWSGSASVTQQAKLTHVGGSKLVAGLGVHETKGKPNRREVKPCGIIRIWPLEAMSKINLLGNN
jgi:hypothetical protein